MRISIKELVGNGYNDFWNCKKRYRVVKGSRGSKKSCTTALWYIYKLMYHFHKFGSMPHLLVIRRYYNTHKDSTRAQLIWAINKLNVSHLWHIPKGDTTLIYKPSGQKVLFRGMDDPQSITSITVDKGNICWVWFEEAFQITDEGDFDKVDLSIRGMLPEDLFYQFTLTFNPWSDKSWLKKRFFDVKDEDVFSTTTDYTCNEFLDEATIKLFEKMKIQNPKRYKIEGLGDWGIAEGLIYENWEVKEFDIEKILTDKNLKLCRGMDFGYNDPTAFIACAVDTKKYLIYVYDEFCKVMMENRKIANWLIEKGYNRCVIKADSEDTRTINELKLLGIRGIVGCRKGKGSVLGGIQKLQDYHIIVHPRCGETIIALNNYAWKKDKNEKETSEPEHDFSHIPDALRYATEDINKFIIQV